MISNFHASIHVQICPQLLSPCFLVLYHLSCYIDHPQKKNLLYRCFGTLYILLSNAKKKHGLRVHSLVFWSRRQYTCWITESMLILHWYGAFGIYMLHIHSNRASLSCQVCFIVHNRHHSCTSSLCTICLFFILELLRCGSLLRMFRTSASTLCSACTIFMLHIVL